MSIVLSAIERTDCPAMESGEFSKYLSQIYGHGAVMLAVALGHDLGLFKLLCDVQSPLSAQEIADHTGLKEMYTKEWLSSMVAARIIHQDRVTDLYIIPDTHREELKLRASFASSTFLLSDKRHDIKSCFSKDGPYGLGFWPEFFEWHNDFRAGSVDHILDANVIPKLKDHNMIPKLALHCLKLLSLKRTAALKGLTCIVESGIKVVDLGCGTGNLTIGLARRFSNCHFTALEYSDHALEKGRELATKAGVLNITFVSGDAHSLPDSMTGCFDLVFVYNVLHDLPDPHMALTQIHKIMKEDGRFFLVESGMHSNPCDNMGNLDAAMYYAMGLFTCLPSSMTEEKHVGYGACWGCENVEKALHTAGFNILGQASSVIVTGPQAVYFCSK